MKSNRLDSDWIFIWSQFDSIQHNHSQPTLFLRITGNDNELQCNDQIGMTKFGMVKMEQVESGRGDQLVVTTNIMLVRSEFYNKRTLLMVIGGFRIFILMDIMKEFEIEKWEKCIGCMKGNDMVGKKKKKRKDFFL
eukprot:290654_1